MSTASTTKKVYITLSVISFFAITLTYVIYWLNWMTPLLEIRFGEPLVIDGTEIYEIVVFIDGSGDAFHSG